MGFWGKAFEIAGDVGSALWTGMKLEMEKIKEQKEKFQSKSDDFLINILRNRHSPLRERMASSSLLKERGWTSEQLKEYVDLLKLEEEFKRSYS